MSTEENEHREPTDIDGNPIQLGSIFDGVQMEFESGLKFWVAINQASIARSGFPMKVPRVSPTPEMLIGFKKSVDAQYAQRFLLTEPISACKKYLKLLSKRNDVEVITMANPEPPSAQTCWG